MSKLTDIVDNIKFTIEDAVYFLKNRVLNVVDYVKYDVLKKDYDLPEFNIENDEVEKAPKKKKKKSNKKKKK
jgi:hypothetical protein